MNTWNFTSFVSVSAVLHCISFYPALSLFRKAERCSNAFVRRRAKEKGRGESCQTQSQEEQRRQARHALRYGRSGARCISGWSGFQQREGPPVFRHSKNMYTLRMCADALYTGFIPTRKTPPSAFLNSSYDGSFIVGLMELRYIQSLPIERIVCYFEDHGFTLNKPTAHKLTERASLQLAKLALMAGR